MLAVSFLPMRTVVSRLPRASRYFNDTIIWGPTSGALMWREMAETLVAYKAEAYVDERVPSQTALMRACDRGAPLANVRTLLTGGANATINAVDGHGSTALAEVLHDVDIVRTLLQENADPNMKTTYGCTPLMWASSHTCLSTVAALLDAGARINDTDEYGWTALVWAIISNRIDMVRMLLTKRADVNLRDRKGENALDAARFRRLYDIVAILESAMTQS